MTSADFGVIVVGASAGGVDALSSMVAGLPADLPAAMLVVLHVSPTGKSVLPRILSSRGPLPAHHAVDGEALEAGKIYVAPPDHHLELESGCIRLTAGPRENGLRPSLDTLFRSAAARFGPKVIGVVLSGTLDDGTAGLIAIKRSGGVAVVQDPEEALFPSMPASAARFASPDYVTPLEKLPALLASIVATLAESSSPENAEAAEDRARAAPQSGEDRARAAPQSGEDRARAAPQSGEDRARAAPQSGEDRARAALHSGAHRPPAGKVSEFTCAECGGTLWGQQDGELLRFECRVGHGFSGESLLGAQQRVLESALWAAVVALEERGDLAERLAGRMRGLTADRYHREAADARHRAVLVRDAIFHLGLPGDDLREEA